MRGSRSRQQQQHQGEHQSILNSPAEFAACLFSRMAAEPTLTFIHHFICSIKSEYSFFKKYF